MIKSIWFKVLVVCFSVSFLTSAQINLNSFGGRLMEQSDRAWNYQFDTEVESLIVETNVDKGGIVETKFTISIRPGRGRLRFKAEGDKEGIDSDSIEIRTSFSLPTDFAAKDLFLWIEGEKVRGYVQDKALASEQYQDIVGVRLDPALLEYNGGGRYSLRIFPASTQEVRKVQIVYEHTMDDDSANTVNAPIPVRADSLKFYKGEFSSSGDEAYNCDIPGIGSERILPGRKAVFEESGVTDLGVGNISSEDPSGRMEYMWQGSDKTTDEKVIGFSTLLTQDNIDFVSEPETRIIVIDVGQEFWNWKDYYSRLDDCAGNINYSYSYPTAQDINVWEKAQKYAVLCMREYLNEDSKFNIVFSGGTVSTVFDSPVKATDENLREAFIAVSDAEFQTGPDRLEAVKKGVEQADEGAVIYISDLYYPWNYYECTSADGYNNNNEVSEDGEKYINFLEGIASVIDSSNGTFFTISDDYRLRQTAHSSTVYQLSSLRWYRSIDNGQTDDNGNAIYLDDLYRFQGFTGVEVKPLSVNLRDMVWTNDNDQGFGVIPEPRIMLSEAVPAKKRTVGYSNDLVMIRAGAKLQEGIKCRGNGNARGWECRFIVSGKYKGQKFTKEITGKPFQYNKSGDSTVQWGFRKTEQLVDGSRYVYKGNEIWDDVKRIGKDYHIATRATSLLALEPWMELYTDSGAHSGAQEEIAFMEAGAPLDNSIIAVDAADIGALNLDKTRDAITIFSLEEIFKGNTAEASVEESGTDRINARAFSAVMKGSLVRINLSREMMESDVEVSLYSLRGREIMKRLYSKGSVSDGLISMDLNESVPNGTYILSVSAGRSVRNVKLGVIK